MLLPGRWRRENNSLLHRTGTPGTSLCHQQKTISYYVACVEDSIILVSNDAIQKNSFEKFPRFESLCRIFSERQLAKNQSSFDHFKTSSPEERYLHLQNTRPDLIQRVPQYQLASYLGITPQSLSRLRSRIAVKG